MQHHLSNSHLDDALARRHVTHLVTEVWQDDISSYLEMENDLCHDWLPFMTSIAYELRLSPSPEVSKSDTEMAV